MALRADHAEFSIPLAGAGGEAVSFRATLGSHGLAWLPPNELGPELDRLETTLLLADGTARRIVVREEPLRELRIAVAGRPPSALARREIAGIVRKMFGLDDDLAPFYARLSNDPDLAFAASQGVGRMLRSPTAFEDVVRTICTTNCTWSATERMIEALVAHLGTPTAGASADRRRSRAFPSAQQLLEADDRFYREVAR